MGNQNTAVDQQFLYKEGHEIFRGTPFFKMKKLKKNQYIFYSINHIYT